MLNSGFEVGFGSFTGLYTTPYNPETCRGYFDLGSGKGDL